MFPGPFVGTRMTHLAPLQLEDGSIIYIEAEETALVPETPITGETTRTAKGAGQQTRQQFQAMQDTIRTYTRQTLDAFREMAIANVDKVTLEFGVKVAGEAGVPYITKSNAECNLKITVECSFQNGQQP
ncbi:hypothetical protein S7335_1030 [Synechococcus sp. PCC 7335]|nr:hypothetical protein S7335_1030 [Synechococcus sp. PCC 7335]